MPALIRKLSPALGLALICATAAAQPSYTPRDGDIVFHTSTSAQSLAVQQATHSRYSHMGVVIIEGGKAQVLEAVEPVKLTPLGDWLARGKDGHYVIKRAKMPLSPADLKRFHQQAPSYLGKHYDLTFEWSDSRIYCSELVWKLYKSAFGLELAPLAKLGSFDLSGPAVQAKLKERYGDKVPLDEPVIAPVAIFDSAQLVTVAKK